jgi:hypothetical protein
MMTAVTEDRYIWMIGESYEYKGAIVNFRPKNRFTVIRFDTHEEVWREMQSKGAPMSGHGVAHGEGRLIQILTDDYLEHYYDTETQTWHRAGFFEAPEVPDFDIDFEDGCRL